MSRKIPYSERSSHTSGPACNFRQLSSVGICLQRSNNFSKITPLNCLIATGVQNFVCIEQTTKIRDQEVGLSQELAEIHLSMWRI